MECKICKKDIDKGKVIFMAFCLKCYKQEMKIMGKSKEQMLSEEWIEHPLRLEKDSKKSYYYVYDGEDCIGLFAWDFQKRKYVFDLEED